MIDERKSSLLCIIVEEHAKSAEPIGSQAIASKAPLNVSSATIRNEMALLEELGYIYQPHTSAGRVPTEKGYQYYIEHFLVEREPGKKDQQSLKQVIKKIHERTLKDLAKCLAETTGQGVLIGFNKNDIYYTGISNLFNQPEFYNYQYLYSMSVIIDRLDEAVGDAFEMIDEKTEILIGSKNPFGNGASAILTKYHSKKFKDGLLGVFGPLRMDYQKNLSLINYCRQLISNL